MTQSAPLRLAIISDAIHPYNKGGKETRLHELTTRLAAAGHDVHIYTMQWWTGPKHRVEDGAHLHAISRLRPLYSGRRRSIRQGLWFALACLKLIREPFDIIEADHMPFFPLYSVKVVSLLRRRPFYATWHEVWGPQTWRAYLGRPGAIAWLIEKYSVRLPHHIIAVSPMTARQLRQDLHYRGPLTLAPNGINAELIAATPPGAPSDIIFTGRLLAHKNVDLLIRAVALLVSERPKLSCLIVGDGPDRPRLEALVAELDLDRHIRFTGFVAADATVYGFMKASRVFVLPSSREGFGITALEAGACGLPVVTVDLPGNATRHLITSATGLVCAATPADLAAAIGHWLATNPAPSLAANIIATHDWSHAAHTVAEAYQS